MKHFKILRLITLILLTSTIIYAQRVPLSTIYATRVESAPQIDGLLNDDVWQKAIPTTGFTQQEPNAGAKPTFRTEVRMIYDNDNLYLGVYCFDDEPEKIIAREMKWDGRISSDDNIKIIFDTFNDNRSAYWFGTNPLGSQNDALLTGFEMKDFNEDWDAVWDVACSINDDGWSAEFQFPFSSLRFYDKEKQVWGFNIERGIRRLNEQVIWTSVGQNLGLLKIAEAGDLLGLENIKRGNPIYLIPYITGGAQSVEGEKKYVAEPGFDLKYGITETLSLDITLNTDFAQVESDRAIINLTRFPLFFPEKRDFFLEGAKTFDFNLGFRNYLFYSRRIGISGGEEVPIIGGAKLIGKVGEFELGFINMQTSAKREIPTTNFSVARVKYDLFDQSYIGILLTNKTSEKSFNSSIGADARFSFNNFLDDKNLILSASISKTHQPNGANDSWSGNFFIDYPNDLIDMFAGYRFVNENFNPEMGYVSRVGIKNLIYRFGLTPRVNWNGIRKLNFEPLMANYVFNEQNVLESASLSISPFGFQTDAGDRFSIEVEREFDMPEKDFEIFESIIIKSGKYWFTYYEADFNTSGSRTISGGAEFGFGDFYNGIRKSFGVSGTINTNKNFTISGDYSVNSITIGGKNFVTNEVGGRLNYDFSTRISSSLFAQWNNEENEINVNYRFNWKPKIGSDLYLVINQILSTENKLQSKAFTILAKFVWLFVI
jgi:hypothetical protein